jgi:hypothetical protein
MRALLLFVATICKCSINPVTNKNPIYNQSLIHMIILILPLFISKWSPEHLLSLPLQSKFLVKVLIKQQAILESRGMGYSDLYLLCKLSPYDGPIVRPSVPTSSRSSMTDSRIEES